MNRMIAAGVVVSFSTVVVGASALVKVGLEEQDGATTRPATRPTTQPYQKTMTIPVGRAVAEKLPEGTTTVPESKDGRIETRAMCGLCSWGIGHDCSLVLWDKRLQHAYFVLPSKQLKALHKITGDCPGGAWDVRARGWITQYDGLNYILIDTFDAE